MQHDSKAHLNLETFQALEARLSEAEETLRAIRAGEIDALIVQGTQGERVYTLRNADYPYRTLVEQMQDGAAILSPDGDILYCNQSFAGLATTPLQEVIGGPVARYFAGDAGQVLDTLLAAGCGKRRARLRAGDGREVDVLLSLTSTATNEIERRSLIVTDLTQLSDAQIGLERAQQQSHAKDEFMAMLAHELRNPLSAISAALEVLQAGGSNDAMAGRARAIISRQTRNLSRLVDDLLEVARVITGKVALAGLPLELGDAVHRCVVQLEPRTEERRIELEIAGGPHWIHGDPVRIEQIVTNILSNAIKYSGAGGVIRVTLSAEDNETVLRVIDNGLGISPELLPQIFEPFVQGERTLDRSQGGLGVGLTLVRRLVELHGGTVQASSDGPGCGSTFTIRLPRVAPPCAKPISRGKQPKTLPRRVLLIEDNRDARETFRMMLELAGHEVMEAEEGHRGLELLKTELPDIAVIDVGLPGLDGYQIASSFRREPTGNRVLLVALTGYGTPDARERSRAAGFDHHLIKPIDPEVLRELMVSVPERPRP
ncbi:MAG TPA: ATP-binding protein [Steroidobacteraceae bacterium]|nr:ATP-binding protein [Steroidobacteraceae bacterium]